MQQARQRVVHVAVALVGSTLLATILSVAPADALVGGSTTTNPGYAAALVYRPASAGNAADREFCTGTLIAPRWVLTAAHCLKGTGLKQYQVVLGRTTLSAGGGEIIRPARQFINQHYHGEGYDVGLVKLMRAASESPAPVADDSLAAQWSVGSYLLVSGWGYTCPAETNSCQGDHLKSGLMRVRTDAACDAAVGPINRATELCTRTPGLSLGSGDSGGPAVITQDGPLLVAVNSWGEVDNNDRDVVGGWMGYAQVAGTVLATWVANTIASN